MKGVEITLALTIFLIAISLFVPIIMHFYSTSIPTGKTTTTQGTVTVNITGPISCGDSTCNGTETCSNCVADCGVCPASPGVGGGGGGGARIPVVHLLDFEEDDTYSFVAIEGDWVEVKLSGGVLHKFEITWASAAYLSLELNNIEYGIANNEIGYFDFDNDGNNDLSILYIGETRETIWTVLEKDVEPTGQIAPIFSKEKAKLAVGSDVEMFGRTISLIPILIVFVAILIVFMMLHNTKLKKIEGHQKKKLNKIYNDYSKKKKTVEVKIKVKDKLSKQKNALERAYKSGYVKKDAYSKGKKRIDDLMKKI